MVNTIYKKKKICIINLFFGEWPEWMPFFLVSCEINSNFDFILFSDASPINNLPKNIKFYSLSKNDFNSLATNKIGITIKVRNPYKICDFKPSFGKIFYDYLIGYDFWGYCDLDMIFGRIGSFVNPQMLEQYDIISMYKGFLSGPFCLYRNKPRINNLYMNCANYRKTLQDIKCRGFDEKIQRPDLEGFTLHKAFFLLFWFVRNVFSNKIPILNFKEIRYQFQWSYKKLMLKEKEPQDMTEIIWQEMRKGRIKVNFKERVLSDSFFYRNNNKNWRLKWSSIGLYNHFNGKELMAFHFRESKMNEYFKVEHPIINSTFVISSEGIFI